jgi:putative ABC transport system substrate-binding protein
MTSVTTRRQFIGALAGGLVAVPLAAGAQQVAKVPRIGFLSSRSPAETAPYSEAFRQGLRELGYVEGQNVAVEYRYAEGRPEGLPALAAELVRLKVDVIVTTSAPAPEAARQATRTIPIVFAVTGDPVAEGLVATVAHPGGNITGLASLGPELAGKQLELLKDVVPKISRMAVLQNPNQPAHPLALRQAESAARALRVQLQVLAARSAVEIDAAFAAMRSQRVGGVVVLRDSVFFNQRAQIVALAAKSRLPAVYGFKEMAEAGGLMAYGASLPPMFRRAATYVDKILRGAKPADLPVEQPTKFELVVNLKTAKALGLTIPQSLLLRADEVIR